MAARSCPAIFKGKPVTVQDVFEAVGKHSVGAMSDEDLQELEEVACPSSGSCGAQFTANTMATVAEAIGLALPYSCGAPAPYDMRDSFCYTAGEMVMELIARNIRPRDIVTRKALENAATVVAASGGSTNGALHLPAIAHECGIDFDLFAVAEIFKKTPYIADLKPGGKYVAKDMFEVGGIPLLMKTLLDHGYLHGDCMTVTGRTIAENLASVKWNDEQDVVAPRRQAAFAQWRRRRPPGQPRARRRDREDRRHDDRAADLHRPGALLRPRGGRLRRRHQARLQGRRRAGHPL
jgi:dihydroxy-acid dehydratase